MFPGLVGQGIHRGRESQTLQFHRYALMRQVVVHGKPRQEFHDPVAKQEAHWPQAEGQQQRNATIKQRKEGAADHLPGLNGRVAGGSGLRPQ